MLYILNKHLILCVVSFVLFEYLVLISAEKDRGGDLLTKTYLLIPIHWCAGREGRAEADECPPSVYRRTRNHRYHGPTAAFNKMNRL